MRNGNYVKVRNEKNNIECEEYEAREKGGKKVCGSGKKENTGKGSKRSRSIFLQLLCCSSHHHSSLPHFPTVV
jgi:hypothetical protein